MTSLADEVDIFTDMETISNPMPWLEALRAKGPVVKLPGRNIVAVVGHREGVSVYQNADDFSSIFSFGGPLQPVEFTESDDISDQISAARPGVLGGNNIITADPPEHGRIKALLMGVITPKRVAENESFVADLADERIDAMLDKGTVEAFEEYGRPIARFTVADLLGVPKEDHEKLVVEAHAPPGAIEAAIEASIQNDNAVRNYFREFVADRRANPKNDVMSRIAQVPYGDGTMPPIEDLVALASLLFTAGEDTSSRVIIGALRWIAEMPDLQDRLRGNPELIPDFVEEMLRYDNPGLASWRVAKRNTKIGDYPVKAGTRIMVAIAGMNRDPQVFEHPAELDIDRPNKRHHVAFARGVHACPGAPVARAEVRIAIERLLARTSRFTIDDDRHGPANDRRYNFLPSYFVKGLVDLHLRLEKA